MNDARIRSRLSSAADGDQVDISTQFIMFEKSNYLYFPDMKLDFPWGHTFRTPPGTHVCYNGVKTLTSFIFHFVERGYFLRWKSCCEVEL